MFLQILETVVKKCKIVSRAYFIPVYSSYLTRFMLEDLVFICLEVC